MQILRRITSGQSYLPFVDGLRFLAIMPVILEHFADFYQKKHPNLIHEDFYNTFFLKYFIGNAANGVLLFFAISGFILGLPFAKAYILNAEKPDLKKYFLRRLTRLEPPYLIVLTGIFVLNIFALHKGSLTEDFPHYAASLIYSHDLIFKEYPTINFVLWSLEIEVQFYLLAPVLACIFKLKSGARHVLFFVTMLLFSVINHYCNFSFLSIVVYLQYFIAGFWAADLYLSVPKNTTKHLFYDVLGIAIAIAIWTGAITYGILLPFGLVAMIYCVQKSVFWYKILELNLLTIIGGMCYSIYMLHYPTMAFLLNRLPVTTNGDGILAFLISLVLVCITTLAISTLFFVLIERPCMRKDWPKQLSLFFRRTIKHSEK